MEHESFEDPLTARVMNERFVWIKVDREERPDLDSVYMDAVVSLTGQGGWPMTVFLTPGRRAVLRRHVLPAGAAARTALVQAGAAVGRRGLGEQRDEVERTAARLAEHIRSGARLQPSPEPLGRDLLAQAQANLRAGFDPQWGGWGRRPKFPPAPVLEFLLRRGEEEMTRARSTR